MQYTDTDITNMINTGKALKIVLLIRGIEIKILASKINKTYATINNQLNGKRELKPSQLGAILNKLDFSYNEFQKILNIITNNDVKDFKIQ